MQHRRPVRVHDALRVAGGAARVAHGRRRPFVDLGPREPGVLGRENLVVAQHVGAGSGVDQRGGVALADDDVVLDRLEVGRDVRQQRDQRVVDDHDTVLGVVHDVRELLREEPDVQRVEYRAHRRYGEVRLEVLLGVPLERADAVTGLDAEPLERGRELLGTSGDLDEGRPSGAVALERDDLAVTVHGTAVLQDHRDGQREILHRALEHFAPQERSVVVRRAHQPRVTPTISPSTRRPPARLVWTNASAANHSGQIGKFSGGSAGFGCENGLQTVASLCRATSTISAAIGSVPVPTSRTTSTVASPRPCFFSRSGGAVYATESTNPLNANTTIGHPRNTSSTTRIARSAALTTIADVSSPRRLIIPDSTGCGAYSARG